MEAMAGEVVEAVVKARVLEVAGAEARAQGILEEGAIGMFGSVMIRMKLKPRKAM